MLGSGPIDMHSDTWRVFSVMCGRAATLQGRRFERRSGANRTGVQRSTTENMRMRIEFGSDQEIAAGS
jgi:hypothetical protein